ncbi:BZ3500_MvSof-1268-A1-R1_Chr3-1g05425 [Microbotryum saponariae]|uniref:BZ3500_MvSof-1268-A1-R1_Chr3-1g05425 protein n=1 Tax=Microbotryum saponariae TaxID=289078 RepID=A0A2X0NGH7_9BASI|nr:BZ3500_MvSof-1268-A1-R1_Chr3-1g05425 [Microbotryum saponariae]SDA04616.1 BZ3501_MvSof-1269-A2-R1_Chr3-1g05096 [Microbotryum saponariae]
MDDPYDEVKSEVEYSLQQLSNLLSSYARLLRAPSSTAEDVSYAHSELLALLSALDNDVQELQEALDLVERDPVISSRLGLSAAVLAQRKRFVERVKEEMKTARKQLATSNGASSNQSSRSRFRSRSQKPHTTIPNPLSSSTRQGTGTPYRDTPYDAAPNGETHQDSDPNADFEMQHQSVSGIHNGQVGITSIAVLIEPTFQLLIEQQDQTLTSISGTVEQLRAQAWTMGQEVYDQNAMLDELDRQVDATGTRLERAQRKMDRFIKANKSRSKDECHEQNSVDGSRLIAFFLNSARSGSPSSWAVFGLIIILSILLFIISFL